MQKDLRNIINGAVYGMTLIIPGVSATMLAIILGFYDELLKTLNHFRENYRKNTRYIAVFLIGVAVGAVVFSSAIVYLLENYSLQTMLFFAGLLTGVIPVIYLQSKGKSKKAEPKKIVMALIAMGALYALSLIAPETELSPAESIGDINAVLLLYIFFAGIINGATLIIPGLSGAFFLLIMGLYPLVVFSISSIGAYFGDMGNTTLLWEICIVLLPYAVGAVIGVLFMARIMEKLLASYPESVYAVILGLVIGSVIIIFRDYILIQSEATLIPILIGAAMFTTAAAASFLLGVRQRDGSRPVKKS